MKREISFEEARNIQLEMLKEIHDFCNSHNIRYSLSYGTLIGAIRHNGFIPWDDDVDIMMPLPDLLKFKEEHSGGMIKYCDVDTEPNYEFAFPRIAYRNTYSWTGLVSKGHGINIDLYPIVSLPEESEMKEFFKRGKYLFDRRINFMNWRSRIVRRLPVTTIPGHKRAIKEYRDFLYNSAPYGSNESYFVVGSPFTKEMLDLCTYHKDLFSDYTTHVFEGLSLNIITHYHEFLTHYYGDYMQLPPESERQPYHNGTYYWK